MGRCIVERLVAEGVQVNALVRNGREAVGPIACSSMHTSTWLQAGVAI